MKLALGTVQFGQPYGVANRSGQVDRTEISNILSYARSKGMDTLDTAVSYGVSERRLGEAGVDGWEIISKLPSLPDLCEDVAIWLRDQVEGSLSRLRVEYLSGLLLHCPNQLLDSRGKELWMALQNLKREGVVGNVGYSIYTPCELASLWRLFKPDLVQVPYNILDRRIEKSGWLKRMNDDGVKIHVRSVFLQGLLLMKKDERPKQFDRWSDLWNKWDVWLKEHDLTAQQGCLNFALEDRNIYKVIVGVDNVTQLKELLSSVDTLEKNFPENLENNDPDLIIPSNWSSL